MRLNLLIEFQVVFTSEQCVSISSFPVPLPLCPGLSFVCYFLSLLTDITMGFEGQKEMHVCALSAILNKNSHCLFAHLCESFISVVQLLSQVRLFATPMDCSAPAFPVLHKISFLFLGKKLLIASTEGQP